MPKCNWILPAGVAAIAAFLAGCKKTGEGEYEIQRPVVGTITDTVRTPTVDVGRDTHRVVTPDVDVNAARGRRDTAARRP